MEVDCFSEMSVIVASFKLVLRHILGGIEENHETNQDNQFLGRDLKPGHPE
jgi:hypothetical protein